MSCRILVAHQHEVIRIGIQALLQSLKDLVICGEAATGLEAIHKAHQLRPDIVIVSFRMPKANGYIVSRRLRQLHPEQRLLILDVVESKSIVRDLLRAGVRGLISDTDSGVDIVNAVEALRGDAVYFTSFVHEIVMEDYLNQSTSAHQKRGIQTLSLREQEVLQLLAEGLTTKEVGMALKMSAKTAETHRSMILRKLEIHNVVQLTHYAVSHDVVHAPVFRLQTELERMEETDVRNFAICEQPISASAAHA